MKTIIYIDLKLLENTIYTNYYGVLASIGKEHCVYTMDLNVLSNSVVLRNDIVIRLSSEKLIVLKNILKNPKDYNCNLADYHSVEELLNYLVSTRFKDVQFKPLTHEVYLNLLSDIIKVNYKNIYNRPIRLDEKTIKALRGIGVILTKH